MIDEQTYFVSYKLQNLIAECGGLLGLFMGCSVLSIVELFYLCLKRVSDRRSEIHAKKTELERRQFLKTNRFVWNMINFKPQEHPVVI